MESCIAIAPCHSQSFEGFCALLKDRSIVSAGRSLIYLIAMEENIPADLDAARAALTKQKALIVILAKARRFDAMPLEHMRLRQLERVVQSLVNIKR